MSRRVFRSAAAIATVLALSGCGERETETALTPLTGVGGNPYCVSDEDEYRLSREARTDLMAAWVLIHHYQYCELNKDKAGTLMQLQLSKDEAEVMAALADFNSRIELGRAELAKAKPATR